MRVRDASAILVQPTYCLWANRALSLPLPNGIAPFRFCFSQLELRVTRWQNNAKSYECSGWRLGYHLELRVRWIPVAKSGSGFRASNGNSSSRLKSLSSIKTCATKCSSTKQNAFILSRQQLISCALTKRAETTFSRLANIYKYSFFCFAF